jgi:hypothetical protein
MRCVVAIRRFEKSDRSDLLEIAAIQAGAHETTRRTPAEVTIFCNETLARNRPAQRRCTELKSHTHLFEKRSVRRTPFGAVDANRYIPGTFKAQYPAGVTRSRRLVCAMKASRGVLLVALALLAIAAVRDVLRLGDASPWHQLYDFGDFYCAGAALDSGADPYRYEPLHGCEHRVNATAAYRNDPGRVVPAPLPPYDFPPFMEAARLPYSTARAIHAAAILLAVALSIAGLAMAGVPLDVAALALLLPAGYVLLGAGQIVPFAMLALVFCGVALTRRHDRLAGIAAALTLIEPHLGLPVCSALLLWTPRSRLTLVATVLVLAAGGALMVGTSGVVEFLLRVLPAQAAAETGYVYQYSLAYLLHAFGTAPSVALFIGALSYVALLAFGVWLGRDAAIRLGRRELIAFVPAACSVVGGSYVHMVDLPFALPAALVLACTAEGRLRSVAIFALSLLAVPWIPVWITKKLFLATLFIVAAILFRMRSSAAAGTATFVTVAAVIYLFELAPPAPLVALTPPGTAPGDLAQHAWHAWVSALPPASLTWLLVKIPTWIALGTTMYVALTSRRRRMLAS